MNLREVTPSQYLAKSPSSRDDRFRGIIEHLEDRLSAILATEVRVSLFEERKAVLADSTVKFLAVDERGRPSSFVLAGAPVGKNLVVRGVERAKAVREACGEDLGRTVLRPIAQGVVGEYDYVAYPYCRPVATGGLLARYDQRRLSDPILYWLARVTAKTCRVSMIEDRCASFSASLESLIAARFVSDRLRRHASDAWARMKNGTWIPRHTLTHFDLWLGNVLFAPHLRGTRLRAPSGTHFVIIDWPGAVVRGYGFFDLIRLSMSLRLPERSLRRHVMRHCTLLGCEPKDAKSHLLAALGHIGSNLENFPIDRYAQMSEQCFARLEAVVT